MDGCDQGPNISTARGECQMVLHVYMGCLFCNIALIPRHKQLNSLNRPKQYTLHDQVS